MSAVNTFIIRLPAALFGLILMTFGALTAHEVLGEKHPKAWFAFGLFYLICPYFTMAARFGLDCNLMLGMSTVFLYAMIRAVKGEGPLWYALAGLSGALTLYTYAVSYIPMALFLLFSLLPIIKYAHTAFFLSGEVPITIPRPAYSLSFKRVDIS